MIVLDTNVIVSAFFNEYGVPGQIVKHVVLGEITLVYDRRILEEYDDVLYRAEFGFPLKQLLKLFERIETKGLRVQSQPLRLPLPDPTDQPFLEVARAAGVELVTGNLKHYPPHLRHGVSVLSPAQWLRDYRHRSNEAG